MDDSSFTTKVKIHSGPVAVQLVVFATRQSVCSMNVETKPPVNSYIQKEQKPGKPMDFLLLLWCDRLFFFFVCPRFGQVSTNAGVAGQREVGGAFQHHHPAAAQPRSAGDSPPQLCFLVPYFMQVLVKHNAFNR